MSCEIEVIHNFIDPKVYDRTRYSSLLHQTVAPDRKVLMHVSNFRPVKRVCDVIRVYAAVSRKIPAALVMVGDGPDRIDAEMEARNLGVSDHVHFLGKIDDVAPLLANADLFLLPSQSESFGLSALEALASGVPVIGTRAGGLVEVVKEDETGSLCEVGDVEAMTAASIRILGDSARWQQMSTAAIDDSRKRFSREEIVGYYEQFYRDALA
jgi:N-acetyl-alpha-D-glucosaminyl L-malate synthase BshA